MKSKITFVLFVLFLLNHSIVSAQKKGMPFNKSTGLVCYTEVVTSTDTKANLYQKAKNWLENFTSIKGNIAVISDDAESGQIVTKVNFQLTQNQRSAYFWYITLKFSLSVKDNKWKYEITNIYAYNLSTGGFYTSDSKGLNAPVEKCDHFDVTDFSKNNKNAENLDIVIKEIISAMKEGMNTPLKTEDKTW